MSRLLCAYFAPDCPSSTGLIYYILAYMSTRAELSAQQAAAHPRGPSRPPADRPLEPRTHRPRAPLLINAGSTITALYLRVLPWTGSKINRAFLKQE